ncbi:MAG TPA: protein translocase subunit SecD, partial [Patescibacteria group bacterium]|nr:protein translocase subunit SecD [Patescibacteria group bacterium]
MKKIWLISFIFVVTLAATLIALPYGIKFKIGNFSIDKKFDLKLGLDLAGGSQLTFEADLSNIPEEKRKTAVEGVRNVIEKRVNLFGVSEPTVQTSRFEGKERIIVELPGITDTQTAITLIGKTAQLQFFEIQDIPATQTASASSQLVATNLTGADLKSASVVFDSQTGKPAISIEFTDEGGKKFEEITGRNVGKTLPIILDDAIVSAPVVQERISGTSAQISGTFTIDEAKQLAIQLNAGAL